MKKFYLLCGAVAIAFSAGAQSRLAQPNLAGKLMIHERRPVIADEQVLGPLNGAAYANRNGNGSGNTSQSVVTLGSAANALTAVGIRNYVWADPTLGNGTVMFTHRGLAQSASLTNGRIFYDISKDNGATWDTTIGEVYDPFASTVIANSQARYPQGAIFDPTMSGDTNAAYMTYYVATLNNTNPSGTTNWGGNAWGVYKLDMSTPKTQHELSSNGTTGVWYVIPELLHMTKNGKTFALSESDYGDADIVNGRGVAYDYTGTMIWQKGTWNGTNDYTYTEQLVSVPSGNMPYNVWYSAPSLSTNTLPVSTMLGSSIAFNDSGDIGYMVCKMFLNNLHSPDTTALYYVYKTTDGGLTWNMTNIPDFDNLDCLCQDSGFSMGVSGQYFDVAMDANDNLHIVTVAGTKYMSSTYGTSIYYYENYGSLFDIYTTDGGTTWRGHKLMGSDIGEIYGVMGDPANSAARQVYDHRAQITRSYDGTKLFFSWFVTDTTSWLPDPANGGYNNQHPDMHVVGYDVNTQTWTTDMNMTAFPALNGDADGACLLGSVSYYALNNGSGGYKIPTVIGIPSATSTNNNPDYLANFTFNYLDGVEVPSSAFTVTNNINCGTGANDVLLNIVTATQNVPATSNDFIVTPARPNPFSGSTEVMVQITKPGTVVMEVRNLLGQVVSSETYSNQSSGVHHYTVNGSDLSTGLYLLTATYNGMQLTQKISVR